MFCTNCGAQIDDKAFVCPSCGVRNLAATPTAPLGKSHLAYVLLGIFAGGLGIHNFYAGYTGRAATQLLLTILSCGMLSIVSFIWAIIEVCVVKVDAEGRPFVD